MAADQRYCLSCGQRRAEARLDYLEVLRGHPPALTAEAPASRDDRQRVSNITIVASIGCLLLAMGVGVLIGTAGGTETAAAPVAAPAQVIKVQGGGTAVADKGASPAAKSKSTAARRDKPDDVATARTAAESKATNPELTRLEELSPEQYQKQAEKLPKVVSTGGKAPPKDDQAPAGGGAFEEIG